MIWALLALLGVPVWLVVGMLAAALWARHRFVQAPGVFKCKLRTTSGEVPGVPDDWPRLPAYARWVHDVLLAHRGIALVRNLALPVAAVTAGPESVDPAEVKRLGDAPLVLTVRLDSEAAVQVAAAGTDADHLAGPVRAPA